MKELSIEDQIYLCKYYQVADITNDLHITKNEAEKLIKKYKENGLYEKYKNMSEEEYEKIINSRDMTKPEIENILLNYGFSQKDVEYKLLMQVIEYMQKNTNDTLKNCLEAVAKNQKCSYAKVLQDLFYYTAERNITTSDILRITLNWKKKGRGKKMKENVIGNIKEKSNDLDKEQAIDVLEHLCDHIIYDNNIKEICYSGTLIKVKKYLLDMLK